MELLTIGNKKWAVGLEWEILPGDGTVAQEAKDVAEKLEELASGLNTKLFKIKIRECNAIKEAQANQTNIYDYKKNSIAYNDFKNFIEEFLEEKDGENNE